MKISLNSISPRLSHRKALIVKVLKLKGWTVRGNTVIVPDDEMAFFEWNLRRYFPLEEYERREDEFAAAEGALCEYADPRQCDCSHCPLKQQCDWLCEHEEAVRI